MVRKTLILLLFVGCGEPTRNTLGNYYGFSDAVGGKSTILDLSGGGNVGAWVPPAKSVSELLGCGEPCSKEKVDAAGRCTDQQIAVRCVNDVIVCDECAAVGKTCSDETPARCVRDCEGTEVCPEGDTCFDMACCPGARWCERGGQAVCDQDGRDYILQDCLDGLDCLDANCRTAKALVHILFDTSGSMSGGNGQYPACDVPGAPISPIGVAKVAYDQLFGDPTFQHVQFALQRFPQSLARASAGAVQSPKCNDSGYWQPNAFMTGDRPGHVIAETGHGAWFLSNIGEIVAVPFPGEAGEDNREALKLWMDFDESFEEPGRVCFQGCAPGEHCGPNGKCRWFNNPELRAGGSTPLGRSLFYAGEYFRKRVVVDGKTCVLDVDCGTPHHFCVEGKCSDPNRFCRPRSIVIFTDGVDNTGGGDWLEPVTQVRRMRSGLSCSSDADCGRAFSCAGGTCQPEDHAEQPCGAVGAECERAELIFPKAGDSERLRDFNGDAIEFTIHVVDASGVEAPDSFAMASYGGGLYVPASLASTVSLYESLFAVFNWKDADFCAQ